MTESYEGWANYETWAVTLWMNNDQSYHEDTRALVRRITDDTAAMSALRDYVEEYMMPVNIHEDASLASDLVGKALTRVDWQEVLDAQRED